jgi:hypothetical protein
MRRERRSSPQLRAALNNGSFRDLIRAVRPLLGSLFKLTIVGILLTSWVATHQRLVGVYLIALTALIGPILFLLSIGEYLGQWTLPQWMLPVRTAVRIVHLPETLLDGWHLLLDYFE